MVLEVEKVCKSFGEKKVLQNISFKVESGQAFGFLGRNGAGKTTCIRIIMGIFSQDEGRVLLDGKPLNKANIKLGYLPEERGLYPKKTIKEQMVYFGQIRGMSAKEAENSAINLLERLEALEYFDKKLEALSKGNQQKIQLAISVLNDPDIVVLDEPFSGLDPVNAKLLKQLVVDQVSKNKIVIFSSHQMPYVEEFCRHIGILKGGNLVLEGDLKDIKKSYIRNKIKITPEHDILSFIEKIKQSSKISSLCQNIEQWEDSCIVILKNEKTKSDLFKSIVELGTAVDSFIVLEPTLEEIFVENAGDING